jgi:hypothetical protein
MLDDTDFSLLTATPLGESGCGETRHPLAANVGEIAKRAEKNGKVPGLSGCRPGLRGGG